MPTDDSMAGHATTTRRCNRQNWNEHILINSKNIIEKHLGLFQVGLCMDLATALALIADERTEWTNVIAPIAGEPVQISVCNQDVNLRVYRLGREDEPFYKASNGPNPKETDDREPWLRACSAPYYSLYTDHYIAYYGASPIGEAELVTVDGGRATMPFPNKDDNGKPIGFNALERGFAGAVGGWKSLRTYAEKARIPWETT